MYHRHLANEPERIALCTSCGCNTWFPSAMCLRDCWKPVEGFKTMKAAPFDGCCLWKTPICRTDHFSLVPDRPCSSTCLRTYVISIYLKVIPSLYSGSSLYQRSDPHLLCFLLRSYLQNEAESHPQSPFSVQKLSEHRWTRVRPGTMTEVFSCLTG